MTARTAGQGGGEADGYEPDDIVEAECSLCRGEGTVDYYVSGINYHDGSLNEHWRTCPQCHGSGTGWAASVPATEEEIMEDANG